MQNHHHQETLGYYKAWAIPPAICLLIATLTLSGLLGTGDGAIIPVGIIVLSLLFPIVFLLTAKLRFEFHEDSVKFRYSFFDKGEYFREDIESAEVIESDFTTAFDGYNPLRDKNLVMGGQYGLRLRLKSGKTVLFTTRQPRQLREFLKWWMAEDRTAETLDLYDRQAQRSAPKMAAYNHEDLV